LAYALAKPLGRSAHVQWTIRILATGIVALIGQNIRQPVRDDVSDPKIVRWLRPGCYPAQARAAACQQGTVWPDRTPAVIRS
jgi:hypothetical protein